MKKITQITNTGLILCLSLTTLINATMALAAGPGDLNDARYDNLRSEFLNVNPALISDVDLNKVYTQSGDNGLAFINGQTNMGIRMDESSTNSKRTRYGARYWCDNASGGKSLCWLSTGGFLSDSGECGKRTGNDLVKANDPAYQCNKPNHPWSGYRLWLNAYDNRDYIIDAFKPPIASKDANQIPVNRLCFEYELPSTGMDFSTSRSGSEIKATPELANLVNPEKVNDGYQEMNVLFGTYTCNRKNLAGATEGDEECSGTFQAGGTHFYHVPTTYDRHQPDKIYALDAATFVICMSPHPTGVRTGMRPTHGINPMQTMVGETNGQTDAYAYHSYVTRLYLDFLTKTSVNHPLNIKLNRMWFMYEQDDILLTDSRNAVRGMDLIMQGDTAYYPITLKNRAKQNRNYRVYMMAAGVQALRSPQSYFKIYRDNNANGRLDPTEKVAANEIIPSQILTVAAKTSINLIAAHTPNFTSRNHTSSRANYGRKSAAAALMISEDKRMRSSAYSIRTWQANSQSEVDNNKQAVLAGLQYPDNGGSPAIPGTYKQLEAFNQKRDNNWLIRNWPDYQFFMGMGFNIGAIPAINSYLLLEDDSTPSANK